MDKAILRQLYESCLYSDFAIRDENDNIMKVHKIVLHTCKYFQTLFASRIGLEDGEERSEMMVPDVNIIRPIIKFIYTDVVDADLFNSFDGHELLMMLETAEMYELPDGSFMSVILKLRASTIICDVPDSLGIVLDLMERSGISDPIIYNDIVVEAGVKLQDIDDEIVRKLILRLDASFALELVEKTHKVQFLDDILGKKGSIANCIYDYSSVLLRIRDPEGNIAIPYELIGDVMKKSSCISVRKGNPSFGGAIKAYLVNSFYPRDITKYQLAGVVLNAAEDSIYIIWDTKCTIDAIRTNDIIISERNFTEEHKVEEITVEEISVPVVYSNITCELKISKHTFQEYEAVYRVERI